MSLDVVLHTLNSLQVLANEDKVNVNEITYLCAVLEGYVSDGILENSIRRLPFNGQPFAESLQHILSIPDKVSNAVRDLPLPKLLHYEEFHTTLYRQCFHSLFASRPLAPTSSEGISKLGLLTSLMTRRGHASLCSRHIWKSMQKLGGDASGSREDVIGLFASFFGSLQEIAAERVVEALIRQWSTKATEVPGDHQWTVKVPEEILVAAIADLMANGNKCYRRLIGQKWAGDKPFPRHGIELCVKMLFLADEKIETMGNAKKMPSLSKASGERALGRWSDTQFVLIATGEEHEAVGCALMSFLSRWNSEVVGAMDGLPKVIKGVQARLASPVSIARQWAAIVARKFSLMMDVQDVIDFDEFPNALEIWLEGRDPYSAPRKPLPLPSEVEDHVASHRAPRPRKKPKKTKLEEDDPDALIFGDEDGDDEEEEEEEEEEDDDDFSDDVSSLASYDMEDESSNPRAPQFRHVNDVLEALTANGEDVDAIEGGLRSLQELVESCPDDLDNVSAQLARVLLHMQDAYAIDDYDTLRLGSMVSLAVHSTLLVVPYLTSQFYLENLNLSQRADILQVLQGSAQRLANAKRDSGTQNGLGTGSKLRPGLRTYPPIEMPSQSQQSLAQKEKLEKQTRRWGQRTQAPAKTTVNRFVQFAPLYIFNLLRDHDRKHYKISEADDPFVLGKLVYTMGIFVECCNGVGHVLQNIIPPILEFIWPLKAQSQNYVLAQVIGTCLRCFSHVSVDMYSAVERHTNQWQGWLMEMASQTDAADLKTLAGATLSVMYALMQQAAPKLVIPL